MHKLSLSLLVMTMAASSIPVFAEEASEVVVTASRTAESVDDTTASVTVITREDIEQSQAQDLMEILRLQPGIEVTRYGGPGTGTSVFMRGTSNKQLLVLVDGVRVASATTGSFAWESLNLDQIERIEIVRGPMASVYGSDAIGGVISITTRKAGEDYVGIKVGSYGYRELYTSLSGGDQQENFALNLSTQSNSGFSATNTNSGSYNADTDGYDATSISGQYTKQLSERSRLMTNFWNNDGRSDFDSGANTAYSQLTNSAFSIGLQTNVSDNQVRTLQLGYAIDHIVTISDFPSDIRTNRTTFSWQYDKQRNSNSFIVYGLDYYHDQAANVDMSVNPPATNFNETIQNTGLFWIWNRKQDNKTLQISLRGDYHNSYGFHPSGSIAWAKQTSEQGRWKVSLAHGFRAPNINELYHPGYGGFYAGNPNLLPETSYSFELGYQRTPNTNKQWAVNLFFNDVTNQIEYAGTNSQAINIGHAQTPGLEFTYVNKHQVWTNGMNLTLQDPRNADTNALLVRRANAMLTITNQRKLANNGSFASELIWSGARADGANTLAPYVLWNMAASRSLSKSSRISLRIENVLDSQYEYIYGYNTPGRSFYVGYSHTL